MSRSPEQQNAVASAGWIRFCQWCWARRNFVWGVLVVGIILGVTVNWLTSSTSIFTGTPLGTILLWLRDHLLFAGFIGACLLFFTLFVGTVSYLANASIRASSASDIQRSRGAVIRLLRGEYHRQTTESLQGTTLMALTLQQRTDMLYSFAPLVSWRIESSEEIPLPAPASIIQAYDDAGRGLLILGVPGAGKSTLLRNLASELLARAEDDTEQPIPVNVNLSSWSIKKPPLVAWMVDRLWETYNIPPHMSQALIGQNQLLFLLDGLDEVEASARTKCIEAINDYLAKQEYIIPIVVCSRSREYQEQGERLRLSIAVEVRPLTTEQVNSYLKGAGNSLASVRAMLRNNAILRELITTPLMLSIITLAYRGKTVKDLPQLGSAEDQQLQVFDRYVIQMLKQRGREWHYTPDKACHWLIWLAQGMKQHGFTEFYVEHLQPTWLPTKQAQTIYRMSFWLLVGLLSVLLFGLLAGLLFGLVFGLFSVMITKIIRDNQTKRFSRQATILPKREINPSEKLSWSWKLFLIGLAFGLSSSTITDLLIGLTFYGQLDRQFYVLLFGTSAGQSSGQSARLLTELLVGLLFALFIGLLVGLASTQIDEHIRLRPNQGILTSGRNALRIISLAVLPSMLLNVLLNLLSKDRVTSIFFWTLFRPFLNVPYLVLLTGLLVGLLVGLLFALPIGLTFGGIVYLQHYFLRCFLWRKRAMPWHYVRFLEEATERVLLQRVGNGYRFIHPLFLDYFALLDSIPDSNPTEEPTP